MFFQDISSLIGWLARRQKPVWLMRRFQHWFIKRYQVALHEMQGTLDDYKSVAQLFARPLKPGLRPMQGSLVCPVDGHLRSIEQVQVGRLLQVKGKHYEVERLLGSADLAAQFEGGVALNMYLSPQDYHRVHVPLACKLVSVEYLPGYLWPVNDWALNRRQGLFSDNERVVAVFESGAAKIAMVLVGALNVGAISLSCVANFPQVTHGKQRERRDFAPPLELELGAEFGMFALGSSVLLLFSPGYLAPENVKLQVGSAVRVGQAICV
jgi:phosphatidylserine decarboxylase